jgi:TPR repeat protein
MLEYSEVLNEFYFKNIDQTMYEKSFALLVRSADLGNDKAQHKLSAIYATGISLGGNFLVPMDAGRSITLEYMSALGGNVLANMGMGYRYLYGVGVEESCELALPFYEFAANAAAHSLSQSLSVPLLALSAQIDRSRLSDPGAHSSSWRAHLQQAWAFLGMEPFGGGGAAREHRGEANEELTDYYEHLAEKGDANAALTLGNLFLQGSRLIPVDLTKAKYFLRLAAQQDVPGH